MGTVFNKDIISETELLKTHKADKQQLILSLDSYGESKYLGIGFQMMLIIQGLNIDEVPSNSEAFLFFFYNFKLVKNICSYEYKNFNDNYNGYSILGAVIIAQYATTEEKKDLIIGLQKQGIKQTLKDNILNNIHIYDKMTMLSKKLIIFVLCDCFSIIHDINQYIANFILMDVRNSYSIL